MLTTTRIWFKRIHFPKLDHPAVPTFVPAHSSPSEYNLKISSPHTNEQQPQPQPQPQQQQQQQQQQTQTQTHTHTHTHTQPHTHTHTQPHHISSPRCYHHYDHHYPPVEVSLPLGAAKPCGSRDSQKPNEETLNIAPRERGDPKHD